jgi:hypothetical protein
MFGIVPLEIMFLLFLVVAWLAILVYFILLAARLVKAVEKIAQSLESKS